MGDSIEEIGFEAFRNCTMLKAISFPKSLAKIGNYAFQKCADNMSVSFNSVEAPELGNNVFKDTIDHDIDFSIPDNADDSYESKEWQERLMGY